ncbi:MAG: Spy/CpxP family protein refolding chaperone [Gammaproteobacteria bacterium]|nr:Spy/CpxP family protein refolding chaperone [Gammaproteobacteria bacterium]
MNKFIKRTLIVVPTLAVAGVLTAGAAMASGWGHTGDHMSGHQGKMMGRHMVSKLDLTDAQEDAMKDMMQGQHSDAKDARQTMGMQFSELAKLESGSDAYIAKAKEIGVMQGERMGQRLIKQANMEAQMLALLTPEQVEKYHQMREEMAEHRAQKMKNHGKKGNHSS